LALKNVQEILEKTKRPASIIQEAEKRYPELAGEALTPSPSVIGLIPQEVWQFAYRAIPEGLGSWKHETGKEREERAAKAAAERQAAWAARVEKMRLKAPACSVCKKPMQLREDVGPRRDRRTGQEDWVFECCYRRQYVQEAEAK
jgi:hypothetical protein